MAQDSCDARETFYSALLFLASIAEASQLQGGDALPLAFVLECITTIYGLIARVL